MVSIKSIISRDSAGTDVLRLVLCAIIFTHGAYRFYEGSTPIMGELLEEAGFPIGTALAYCVNIAETAGSVLLALRLLVLPLAAILSLIYVVGIMLFHRHAGFFVVGPGENGWEYSALLITCLLTTAWQHRRQAAVC